MSAIGRVLALAAFVLAVPALAHAAAPDAAFVRQPVVVDGATLFKVGASTAAAAHERADLIEQRIYAAIDDPSAKPDDIAADVRGNAATIRSGDRTIFILNDVDAASNEITVPEAAARVASVIREAVATGKAERTPEARALHAVIALVGLAVIGVIAGVIWWLFGWLAARSQTSSFRDRTLTLAGGVQLPLWPFAVVLTSFVRLLRWVAAGAALYVCVPLVLRLFPSQRALAASLIGPVRASLGAFFDGFVAWLPHLALVALIAFGAMEIVAILKMARDEMASGRFVLSGFEKDWIEPTYRLLAFAVIVVAVMAALPQMPGFDSPSFKAVGLLLSALATFASATTVANVFAGIVLIYVPSFRIGDFVRIGDVEGEVVEKSLFVTQIRTVKNVVVTMPNASVLGASASNFSTTSLRGSVPLIVHTTVTLGYDAPWRDVTAALVAAALATTHVLADPAPYVRQTRLNDSNVEYELNAFTREPLLLRAILGELHQQMQDACNARGIEILSPAYQAVRDGNHSTIPSAYLPPGYAAPGFRIDRSEKRGN